MIIFGLVILSSIVWCAAGYIYGYRKGIKTGAKATLNKVIPLVDAEMNRSMLKLAKDISNDVNTRWGKFLGFDDKEIEKAKDQAKKNYEKELN